MKRKIRKTEYICDFCGEKIGWVDYYVLGRKVTWIKAWFNMGRFMHHSNWGKVHICKDCVRRLKSKLTTQSMLNVCKRCKKAGFSFQFFSYFDGLVTWDTELCKKCANELRREAVREYLCR